MGGKYLFGIDASKSEEQKGDAKITTPSKTVTHISVSANIVAM